MLSLILILPSRPAQPNMGAALLPNAFSFKRNTKHMTVNHLSRSTLLGQEVYRGKLTVTVRYQIYDFLFFNYN